MKFYPSNAPLMLSASFSREVLSNDRIHILRRCSLPYEARVYYSLPVLFDMRTKTRDAKDNGFHKSHECIFLLCHILMMHFACVVELAVGTETIRGLTASFISNPPSLPRTTSGLSFSSHPPFISKASYSI